MSWLGNFTLVMRSSLTALREKIEDPERMLNQLLIDMEEELDRVRACVADAIVDEIRISKSAERARSDALAWDARAKESLQRGDSASARLALEQKMNAAARAGRLESEEALQKAETAKLQSAVQDLEDKIRQARGRRTLLLARLARADSGERIHRAVERADSRSAFAQFERLEDRVERAEARSVAYARLDGRDPKAEELERKFREEERRQQIEEELEELKRSAGEGGD